MDIHKYSRTLRIHVYTETYTHPRIGYENFIYVRTFERYRTKDETGKTTHIEKGKSA